ncbi:MAG: MerR family transcriptional regulator [Clostridiales bacterium]|nr:MerR family transcriptional regulator [Clostridiales bacterium]
MEYTIKELADLSGVTTRTLRYYDEIGLLRPSRYEPSGYRVYTEREVDLLQQILLYRSMNLKLSKIKEIITNKNFDINTALIEHYNYLLKQRDQIDTLISTVKKTIAYNKGDVDMTSKDKFEGFKREKIKENEEKYGTEIREKYGEDTVKKSNEKFLNLSEEDFKTMKALEDEMFKCLNEVIKSKDLESEAARKVYDNHKKWLSFTWPTYSSQAHVGLANMYVADERFAKYYNERSNESGALVLKDIIEKYAK